MLLRARLCASDARPSSHKIYEVKAENNEVENILAQSYWEMPQTNNQLSNPVHLQVITQRRSEPVLVLEFVETGCNFVFQVLNGVAQWCIELAETRALPAGCSLVSHEFVSNKIMPVTGSTFCSLLNLLHMDDIKLPAWITRVPASTNRPPNHVIAVTLKASPGSPSLAMGHVSMLVSPDTELSEIFRVLRRDWPNFTLRHLGSTELLPAADQKLYSYDLAKTQGTRMKDLGLPVGKTWFVPEPLAIEPVPRRLRNRS